MFLLFCQRDSRGSHDFHTADPSCGHSPHSHPRLSHVAIALYLTVLTEDLLCLKYTNIWAFAGDWPGPHSHLGLGRLWAAGVRCTPPPAPSRARSWARRLSLHPLHLRGVLGPWTGARNCSGPYRDSELSSGPCPRDGGDRGLSCMLAPPSQGSWVAKNKSSFQTAQNNQQRRKEQRNIAARTELVSGPYLPSTDFPGWRRSKTSHQAPEGESTAWPANERT